MSVIRIEQDSLGLRSVPADRKSTTSMCKRTTSSCAAFLGAQGVRHVFGIPGAKIDRVYNALLDSDIQTLVYRLRNRHVGLVAESSSSAASCRGRAGLADKSTLDTAMVFRPVVEILRRSWLRAGER